MNVRYLLCIAAVFGSVGWVKSARILAVLPVFAKSHHVIHQAVLRTLAEAGHQLVVYSPFPMNNPPHNYTHISLDNMRLTVDKLDEITHSLEETPTWRCYDNVLNFHEIIFHRVFGNENIKRLLRSKEHFDLVITEPLLAQEYMLIFGHVFKAPTIGIATTLTSYIINLHMGNSLSLSFIPDKCFPYSNNMSFLERFFNSLCILRGIYVYYNRHIPAVDNKLKTYFPRAPPVLELTKDISLMFVNDHMTADYAQPRPPTMVPIGGIHIGNEQPLPKDIKEFMDTAPVGVILFSLGTYVSDEASFNMTVNVFRRLRQRVLWKSSTVRMDGLPENVMLVKWLPQRDVLAHSKCVLFITHGGLASLHETVYNGVPIVGIPHYIDQHRNVAFFLEKQVGVKVAVSELSEDSLTAAIRTVLTEPKYRKNMRKLSHIFRDRPTSPADSVVFWTEYVLRHNGAAHLKPASTQLMLYQSALLDVIAAIGVILVSLSLVIYFIATNIVYRTRRTNRIVKDLSKKLY